MPRVYPPLEQKSQNHALPPSLVEIVAGFSAGVFSTLAVHPFDVVKTRLQVDQINSAQVGGSWRIMKDLAKNEGFAHGFYRGLNPNLLGNSVSWALYFMWYGNIKDLIQAYRGPNEKLQSIDYFTASGASGILTAVFTNPIWVIKTRMLSTSRHAPGAYNSISHGAREIWNSEGIPGFYRGLVPSLFGVSHGAIQFMAYEKLKIWRAKILAGVGDDDEDLSTHLLLNRKSNLSSIGASVGKGLKGAHETPVRAAEQREQEVELSNWDFLTLSAVSKMFAGSVTYPYQVVRARLQTYDAPQKYKGAMDVVRQVWALEGLAGFYKGLGPNVVRVLPSTCVTFIVYENTKRYLPHFWAEEMGGGGDDSQAKT